jgi:hypothetical protein
MEDDVIELLVIAMVHYTTVRHMLSNLPHASGFPSYAPSFPDGPTPMIPPQSYAIGIQDNLPFSLERRELNQGPVTMGQLPPATFTTSLEGYVSHLSSALLTNCSADAMTATSLSHQLSDGGMSNIFSQSTDSIQNYSEVPTPRHSAGLGANFLRAPTHRPSWQPLVLGVSRITLSSLCYLPGTRCHPPPLWASD